MEYLQSRCKLLRTPCAAGVRQPRVIISERALHFLKVSALLMEIPNPILVIMNHSEMGCGRDFSRSEIGVGSQGSGEPRQAGFTAVIDKHGAGTPRGGRFWRFVHQ